jgi:hypothetical protein
MARPDVLVAVAELLEVGARAGGDGAGPVRQRLEYRVLHWLKGARPSPAISVEQVLFPGSPAESEGELRDEFKQVGRRYLLVLRDQIGILQTVIPPVAATDAVVREANLRANSSL